jgi:plasmid stabilization system protein ParE
MPEKFWRGYAPSKQVKPVFVGSRACKKAIASLSELPTRCSLAPENKDFPFEVRQLFYGSTHHRYRILFTIEDDTVTVLHIRHGRRDSITH